MTTLVAYDAAYMAANIKAVLAKKPLFLPLYTDGPYAASQALVDEIHGNGSGILWNHERSPSQLSGGRPAGVQAAHDAMAAIAARGTPMDGTVGCIYSVDLSVAAADFYRYDAGFDGINDTHAGHLKAGCYGEGALIDHLVAGKRVQLKSWLSASKSFPSWNPASPNVGLYQLVGTDVPNTDKDIITDPTHLGVWWAPGSPYSNGGTVTSPADIQKAIVATPINLGTYGTQALGPVLSELFARGRQSAPILAALNQAAVDSKAGLAAISAALPAIVTAVSNVQAGQLDPTVAANIAKLTDLVTKFATALGGAA
ncbi:hypothetical protein SAMN05444157_1635 [Frankineae bacterium MT45]|nr:hypothetical protein SAMN05444157_1635 [Frankineae bacterium MT45]